MTSKIQRYDPGISGHYNACECMEKCELGEYVSYDDHQAIVDYLEERIRALEVLRLNVP